MFGTYKENDVTILLKDISGIIAPLGTEEREKLILIYRCHSLLRISTENIHGLKILTILS